MGHAARAGRGEWNRRRLVPGKRGQLLGGVDRRVGPDHQDGGGARHQRDRREVAQRIVVRLAQMRRDRDRADRGEKQQMPVGLAFCDVFGPDRAVRARPVLDDDVLPEQRLEPIGEEPRDEIGRSPGREGDDNADDAGGKVVGTGARSRQPTQRHERDGHGHGRAARELHVNLPGFERNGCDEARSHSAGGSARRAGDFAQIAGTG